MTKKPFGPETTELNTERCLCNLHGQPFRDKWPSGWVMWVTFGFKRYDEDGGFLWLTEKDKIKRARLIEGHLDEKPLCCRLGQQRVYETYRQIQKQTGKPWKRAKCQVCKRFQWGGRIKTNSKTMGPQNFKHLCLYCVVFRGKKDPPDGS